MQRKPGALDRIGVIVSTTLGYMHLADGEKERAIRLLDDRPLPSIDGGDSNNDCTNGETVETNGANDAGCVATAT